MAAQVGDSSELGGDVALQEMAMHAWGATGVLTAKDKQVIASREGTELGVRLDGVRGLLGGSPERVLKTIYVTLHHLLNPAWSKKESQMILGRWVFLLQFRRAAMGTLSRSWQVLEKVWPQRHDVQVVHDELLQLVMMSPLIQNDMNTDHDGEVTCSDASEQGGACARSERLTWSGNSLVGSLNDMRLRPLDLPFLVISLFNGVGGAYRVYDILGLIPAGRISVDISRAGNRVTRTTWPSTIELHDVEQIDRDEVARWARLFPHIRELHLYAGFPCVHLSSARAYRKNLDGEGSKLFWKLLEVIQMVQEIFGVYCKVKFVVENVASMDESARRSISDELGICPIKLDPADVLPNSRPRFAWSSEPLYEMEGLQLWKEKEYVRAYVSADPIRVEQWIRPGWRWEAPEGTCFPTFMKSIKRSRPPPQPAGLDRTSEETRERWRQHEYRYPPYQYKPQFLLHHSVHSPRVLDSSERELLLGLGPGHTSSCMSASEAKKSLTDYEDTRCSLAGDSFSILSFAIIGSSLASEMAPRMTPDKIVKRLGLAPGASAHPSVEIPISRWLAYGGDPLHQHRQEDLVRHLGLTVNNTGADVRISTGEDSLTDLDGVVCDWIELEWARGESIGWIADALSGLHFFWPSLRGTLRNAWKMFKSWRRIEAPQRAPPITVLIVQAVVARAVEIQDLAFATVFALSFHCLLRTGEAMALQFQDLEVSTQTGIVSVHSSKSGLRTGSEEAVSIRDPLVLDLVRTLKDTQEYARGQRLWPHSAQHYRNTFAKYMSFFRISHLEMKPYSLRRGGATFLLQEGVAIDVILIRGRWKSLAVARLYLEDGMAQIPRLRVDPLDRRKLTDYAAQCPPSSFWP
eukprot:s3254_g10.t1